MRVVTATYLIICDGDAERYVKNCGVISNSNGEAINCITIDPEDVYGIPLVSFLFLRGRIG